MRILLTGATGFIGSAFIRLALTRGHRIAGLVTPSSSIPDQPPPGKELVWLRGSLDQAPWDAISAFAPEVCVHTAWITTPGIYLESPENEFFRDASLRFLTRFREFGSHIVGLGTCVEYQITGRPFSEEITPLLPTT